MSDDKDPENGGDAMESDEEDEDYVPGADPDEPAGDDDENDAAGGGDDGEGAPAALSITKLRAVDDAFFDLFGYSYTPSMSGKSDDKVPAKRKSALSKRRRILSSIFGRNSSLKLVTHAKKAAASARMKPGGGGMLRLEKRVVTEVKRFAGQEIKVEKVVMVPVMAGDETNAAQSTAASGAAAAAADATTTSQTTGKAKGVDNLLTELSKPEKLSTISKTSADWDLFKSKNADSELKEQLESKAKGKEAYLVKKDFLARVDNRRFELEKAQRDKERARRGK